MRVLLVDDEKELVSALAERLSLRGIEADWVSNADEAIKIVQEKSYDVAVLDIRMPGVSGLDLKKQLEQIHPGMKFIFVTGHGSDQYYRVGAAEAGAEYYLPKPVRIEVLIGKMNEVLGKEKGEP